MTELYICFTPYHVLLSSCIAYGESTQYDKEIIIVEDFSDVDKLVTGLKDWEGDPFEEHVMIKGKFSVDEIPKKSMLNVFRDGSVVNLLKEGVDELRDRYEGVSLDRVFTCNDGRPQSQFLEFECKKTDGMNIYVEDGSELYNDSIESSMPFHEYIFYKMYFGKWYEHTRILGNYKYTDEIRAMRPDLVRDELKNKKIEPINIKNFIDLKKNGLTGSILKGYDVEFDQDPDNIIVFLPHSSFVEERDLRDIYQDIVSRLLEEDKKILLKYHPREKYHYLNGEDNRITILPQSLPSEILILEMIDEPPLVIGDISTCLLTAKFFKEEINVISLINIIGMESKNLKGVFEKIGVLMPDDRTEFEKMLKDI